MAQGGGVGADWATLPMTNGLPGSTHYYTIMAKEADTGHIAPDEGTASLQLFSWGGNACSFSGIPEAITEDEIFNGVGRGGEQCFFAVDVSVGFGATEELRLEQPWAAHQHAVFGGGYGSGGSGGQTYGVFESASIRSVAPGQNVHSVDGEQVTTQIGDIEVTVRFNGGGPTGGYEGTVAHLMRPEPSNVAAMVDAANSVRADMDF